MISRSGKPRAEATSRTLRGWPVVRVGDCVWGLGLPGATGCSLLAWQSGWGQRGQEIESWRLEG